MDYLFQKIKTFFRFIFATGKKKTGYHKIVITGPDFPIYRELFYACETTPLHVRRWSFLQKELPFSRA